LSTEDEDHSGRPTQVTIPENVDAMILDDWRISIKNILVAETLAISRERVGYIIHVIIDMRKLSAKLVPKCLNADQKRDWVLASQAIFDQFRWDPVGFFNHLITMDKTYMIQRPKNNPWNGDTVVPGPTSKELQDTEVIKQGVGICLLRQRWNSDCRLPGKGCNHNGKVLRCISQQTEAATGLQTSRPAFERNLVSRQCCSSQGGQYYIHTRNWQMLTLKFWNTQPTPLIWPLRTTTSFLTSKKHLKGSFRTLRRPH
jgi:hypothetical protein